VHFSDYLKGGFDKQYHGPPPAPPQLRHARGVQEFLAKARELGHLTMPYTNPTWWCDEPKGADVRAARRRPAAPPARRLALAGRYGTPGNRGFTITLWHPAVQAANRETRRLFTAEYPVDVLFQDQCGARSSPYDTNPASPNPAAYADGMISMCDEDAALIPLSTEGGWDGIVNAEAQICGLSWEIVPTQGGPTWRTLRRDTVPTDLWTVYPVAQYLAQDKCSFIYHDLGQFVTNQEVLAWTLGLGFNMTYRCRASDLASPAVRDWIGWLDVLQKQVCSQYLGGRLTGWQHNRQPGRSGVIRSEFGALRITANLDAEPVEVDGAALAGYGFQATSPNLVVGHLQAIEGRTAGPQGVQFASRGDASGADIWVYERPESQVSVALPTALTGQVKVTFDGVAPQVVAGGRSVSFTLPPAAEQTPLVQPPAALAVKAPVDWPGGPPSIGVVDIAEMGLSWTAVTAAQWRDGLAAAGLPVKSLRSQAEVAAALQAGPTRWLAIVNPCGEQFPILKAAEPEAGLQAIAEYVRHGGSWVETGGYTFYAGIAPDGRARWAPGHEQPRARSRRRAGRGAERSAPAHRGWAGVVRHARPDPVADGDGQPQPAEHAAQHPRGRAPGRRQRRLLRRLSARRLGLLVASGRLQPTRRRRRPGGCRRLAPSGQDGARRTAAIRPDATLPRPRHAGRMIRTGQRSGGTMRQARAVLGRGANR